MPDRVLAALDEHTRTVSAAAFEFLWQAKPATAADLVSVTGLSPAIVSRSLRELDASGRVELDDDGAVFGAHGLTLSATPHRIEHPGGSVHTWCAFDAVGIPAARGLDAVVTTTCPTCRRTLEIRISGGIPEESSAVLWLPRSDCTHVRRDFCAIANVFCSRAHLEQWRQKTGGPNGDVLALGVAAVLGKQMWADIAIAKSGCSASASRLRDG
jgi:alkylmercury lyase